MEPARRRIHSTGGDASASDRGADRLGNARTVPLSSADRAVVWFRNDLRLDSNPAWGAATSGHRHVTPLFVIDPSIWDRSPVRRRGRLAAHLEALDRSIQTRGGRLLVHRGDPKSIVPSVAGGSPVFWNSDVTPHAAARDGAVAGLVDGRVHHGRYAVPPGTVRTGSGEPYRVFTPFFRRWLETSRAEWPADGSAEISGDPGEGLPNEREGARPAGEVAARARLARFDEIVDRYLDDRDVPAIEATSDLSEDLRFGTISVRTVERTVGGATPGRQAFVRQLAWREFCAQLMLAFPRLARLELRPEYRSMAWRRDPEGLAAWQAGATGYPIVDAGMRQLAETGWMHNRVRMLTASFLVKDLLIDWRQGERHFARMLRDFDPAQNAANWQWVAGTGADAAPYFRVFNPVSQARRFDSAGEYVRRWVPELAGLGADAIHAPWEAAPLQLAAAGVRLGETYPLPIVDHAVARVEAIAAYEKART